MLSDGTNLLQLQSDETEQKKWTWFSKTVNFKQNTQLKNFQKIKIFMPEITSAVITNKVIYGTNIKVYLDHAEITDASHYAIEIDDEVLNFKLKSPKKTGRNLQIRFFDMEVEVDAVGFIFRRKSIK